eukprot:12190217-Ditylum_brightwellii.AAC.1
MYAATMASRMHHTADDLYGEDNANNVHDIVQKLCKRIMAQKGPNPNNTTDIASILPSDYTNYVLSLATCSDELSEKIK